jgi:hypothetical protein
MIVSIVQAMHVLLQYVCQIYKLLFFKYNKQCCSESFKNIAEKFVDNIKTILNITY